MAIEPNKAQNAPSVESTLGAAKTWFLDAFEPGRGKLPIGLLTVSSVLTVTGIGVFSAGLLIRPSSDADRLLTTSIAPDGQTTLLAFPLNALESRPGTGKLTITAAEGQQITAATIRGTDFAEWKKAVDLQEITGFNPDDSSQFSATKTTKTATATLGDVRNADVWVDTKFSTTTMTATAAELNPLKTSGPLTVVVFAGEGQSVKNVSMSWANPQAANKSNGQLWGGGIATLLGLALLGYIAWDRHQSTVPALQREQRRGSRSTQSTASADGTILPGAETTLTDQTGHLHGGQIPGSKVSLTDASTTSAQTQPNLAQPPGPPHAVPAPGQTPVTVTPSEPTGQPVANQSVADQNVVESPEAASNPDLGQGLTTPPTHTTATGAAAPGKHPDGHPQPANTAGQFGDPGHSAPTDWLESNTVHHIPDEVRRAQETQKSAAAATPDQQADYFGHRPQASPNPQVSPSAHEPPTTDTPDVASISGAGRLSNPPSHSPRRDPGPRPQPATRREHRSAKLSPDAHEPQDSFEMQRITPQELLDGTTGALEQIDPVTGRPVSADQELPRPSRTTKDDQR